jgi:two-component system, chemotaxis family, protein-glutamate methylesterase/glutaminase
MPGLDGLSTLRCIMNRWPRPVIMVSACSEKDADFALEAASAGAFDYMYKQMSTSSLDITHIRTHLVAKIRAAARARISTPAVNPGKKPPSPATIENVPAVSTPAVVAIGASTGGPAALQEILTRLPREFPLPILVVQHMPAGHTAPFADHLNHMCSLPVREASQSEPLQPGVIYIGASGRHLRIVRLHTNSQVVTYPDTQPHHTPHIPSVDVLMQSVAECFGPRSLGVILTGMGNDGAEGIASIYHRGGITIGQDEASCVVYGMPRVCAERGILSRVLPLSEIAPQILHLTRCRIRA